MQIAYDVLKILKDGRFHSGAVLAKKLRVSRSGIWKGIDFLRKLSLIIHAVPGKGYRWYSPMELLDKNLILQNLGDEAKQCLTSIDILNVIPSTNDYLLQRIPHGLRSGSACIAEGQSAGKGRMGRKWHSPFAANIYLSLYWQFALPNHALGGLSLVVGLAIMDALSEIAPLPPGVGIKWPNDIWYHDAKLAGVLVELHREGVVIGVGLNVSTPLEQVEERAITDLNRLWGFLPSRNVLIGNCLRHIVQSFKQFEQTGLSTFASRWSQYDLLQGQVVELTTFDTSEQGVAQGINERGELFVQCGQTLKAIRSGDIRVRAKDSLKHSK